MLLAPGPVDELVYTSMVSSCRGGIPASPARGLRAICGSTTCSGPLSCHSIVFGPIDDANALGLGDLQHDADTARP